MQFKADFGSGALALMPGGGYRVVLYNTTDLAHITDQIHGRSIGREITGGGGEIKAADKLLPAANTPVKTGIILHEHAYEVKFVNANPHPIAIPEKKILKQVNFFTGNNPAKWAKGCNIFTAITYKNVWPGIDVHYYTSGGTFKYDIIVNAGADISKVALAFDGAQSLAVKNGSLIIQTTVDTVKELQPYSYAVTAQGNQAIKCKFNLTGNVLHFKFDGTIPAGTPLVIDPTVIFCSFSGSKADNWGYTATYDGAGNFFAAGIVFATGFPVTNGAYQQFFNGGNNSTGEGQGDIDVLGFDIGIMKFNPAGTNVLFATYLGGTGGNEQPHSLVTDGAGNIIIAGRTNAPDYPVLGQGKAGPCGGQDIVLSKLSPDGDQLLASMRIGGTGDDGVNIKEKDLQIGTISTRRNYGDDARSEVILDDAGNIYLASCTRSADFPVINGVQTSLQGQQDAVLMKFAPTLNSDPLFCTYLGGNGNDAAFVLKIDPQTGNIYTAGATSSTNLPGTSQSASSPISGKFLGGDCDGFINILSNNGATLIKSIYFGTGAADEIFGIEFSKTGGLFITGTTEGIVTPVNSPFNANGNQASGKQFITKLKSDLSGIIYSANFGPPSKYPNISPTAFLVDVCDNVYVSGWGGGLDQVYISPSERYLNSGLTGLSYVSNTALSKPLKDHLPGQGGFYFFVLEHNASSQLFGAFVGSNDKDDFDGVHVDGGTSRFDKSGVIYQAVCTCGPDTALPTANAAYTVNGAYAAHKPYYCNLTSIKIAFNLSGVSSGVKSSIKNISNDTTGCVPLKVTFLDTIGNAKKYIWSFGDGTKDTSTSTVSVSHVYTQVGVYTVRLIAVDSNTCNISDTSYINIRVRKDQSTLAFSDIRLEPCDSLNYMFINSSVPYQNKPFQSNSFTWSFGDGTTLVAGPDTVKHHYTSPGTYPVVLTLTDTNYCNAPDADSLLLNIAVNVAATVSQPAAGCAPYNVQFGNTSTGGEAFAWDFGDGSTSNAANPQHTYQVPGTYTVKMVAINPQSCNKADSTQFTVTVSGKPKASFTFTPLPAQENTPSTFFNSSQGAVAYWWDFGDGSTLRTISIDTTVAHIYNKTGTYTACLTAYNAAGCADTACQQVPAIVVADVDVPNALTPNGDGINDQVHVRGYGIDKINWQIYNRWGMLVFSTTDKNIGWDGRYKGVLQPQEVYTYTLDVLFTDGTKYRKTGDITLLR